MFHSPGRWLMVVCSVLPLCLGARSQAPPPDSKPLPATTGPATKPSPATPLPSARARLGTGSNPFLSLAFSPDGKWLASGGYEKTIQIWDAASGKEVRKWNAPEGNIASLVFSPDGRLLASGGVYDPTVHLWESASGRPVRALEGLLRGTSSLAFAPNGKILAAGGYNTGEVFLWDVATGKPVRQLEGPAVPSPELDSQPFLAPEFSYVAFAPDGKTLASGHRCGLIRIWDAISFRELRHFRGPTSDVFVHLTFSPDSQVLASWGSKIRLWQVGSWKQLHHFGEQPELRIAALAVSPDGRMLASGSTGREVGDNTVHVWEVATGEERLLLEAHEYAIASVVFSPDGSMLVSGSRDGTALIWVVKSRPAAQPVRMSISDKELDRYWSELAGSDAPRAYLAIRALVQNPGRTIHFLQNRLRPMILADPQRLSRLIAALDSGRFKDRQEAGEELALQVELTEPALRKALADKPSAEARRKLEQILQAWKEARFSARQLQMLRATEVLEDIGTSEAKRILEALAAGTPEFRITRDAKASLERLVKRTANGR